MTGGLASVVEPPAPRRPAPRLSRGRSVLADAALGATVCAILGLFVLSPVTLEGLGISYMTSGGGALSKVHPATALILAALALRCLAARRPARTAWRLVTADAGVVLLLGAVAITCGYALAFAHTPITPLIDTFVLPVLVFLLLRDLDPATSRLLALAVGVVLCANAAIALAESLRHIHVIQIDVPAGATSDPMRSGGTFDWRAQLAIDWRATALLGHPLTNGLLTGAFVVCLAAPGSAWLPPAVKLPVALAQIVAMPTFGARTSFVLMVAMLLWLAARRFLGLLGAGQRLDPRTLGRVLLAVVVAVSATAALLASGFADNMIDRFQNDQGSATTRITMFNLFNPLAWSDIVLGPDPDQLVTLQRIEGLEFGIESSWIGLVLSYGLVVAGTLLVGLVAFMHSVWRQTGRGAGLILIYFAFLASVAATLSVKTTVLALLVALVLLFLPKVTSGSARAGADMGAA